MNIWQFRRTIVLLAFGLVSIGAQFSSYLDRPAAPYWKLYWGLMLVCLGIFSGAMTYWRIRFIQKRAQWKA